MNTDDRVQITELADRVRRTGAAGRDPEAADLIRRAFGDPEHAMYVLVQAVLMQEQALRSAHQRIQDLQAHQSFADPDAHNCGGFLSNLFGRRDTAPPHTATRSPRCGGRGVARTPGGPTAPATTVPPDSRAPGEPARGTVHRAGRRPGRPGGPVGCRQVDAVGAPTAVRRSHLRDHPPRRHRPHQHPPREPARPDRVRGTGCPLLDGTLRDNLLLSAPDATDGALAEMLRATGLDDLVRRLPDGSDTRVGPRGVTLSGGERQRLAIARAMLRDPDLLLLDEATAHLDARTEEALHALLAARHDDRTVLVVAHRLDTVRDADAIVVLEHGRVRAVGTHEQLLATDELYQHLATALPTSTVTNR